MFNHPYGWEYIHVDYGDGLDCKPAFRASIINVRLG